MTRLRIQACWLYEARFPHSPCKIETADSPCGQAPASRSAKAALAASLSARQRRYYDAAAQLECGGRHCGRAPIMRAQTRRSCQTVLACLAFLAAVLTLVAVSSHSQNTSLQPPTTSSGGSSRRALETASEVSASEIKPIANRRPIRPGTQHQITFSKPGDVPAQRPEGAAQETLVRDFRQLEAQLRLSSHRSSLNGAALGLRYAHKSQSLLTASDEASDVLRDLWHGSIGGTSCPQVPPPSFFTVSFAKYHYIY